jgi:hypothetical protein
MADRIEREIEEILKKIEKFPDNPNAARQPRRVQPAGGGAVQRWLASLSLRKIMMWALFVVLVAFFARSIPGAYWVLIGALVVFATAFILSMRGGPTASAPQKRWRGQPIDLSGPSWPDRVKAFLKGRKRL